MNLFDDVFKRLLVLKYNKNKCRLLYLPHELFVLKVYKRLSTAELLCLRREVAVCKEQTVECMAVRHFVYKGSEKLELWMGSGMSGDNTAQVSWLNLTDQHTEVMIVCLSTNICILQSAKKLGKHFCFP